MTRLDGDIWLEDVEPTDLNDDFYALARKYHAECFPGFRFDDDVFLEQMHSLIENESVLFKCAWDGGNPVGFVAMLSTFPIGGGPMTGTVLLWYLHPELRSGGVGMKMLDSIVLAGVDLYGVERVELAIRSTAPNDGVVAALHKLGFSTTETYYGKALDLAKPQQYHNDGGKLWAQQEQH